MGASDGILTPLGSLLLLLLFRMAEFVVIGGRAFPTRSEEAGNREGGCDWGFPCGNLEEALEFNGMRLLLEEGALEETGLLPSRIGGGLEYESG